MDELSPGTVRQHCDERCKFVPPLGCRLVQRCMEQILVVHWLNAAWGLQEECDVLSLVLSKCLGCWSCFSNSETLHGDTNALIARYAIGVRSCSFFVTAGPRWTKVFRFYQSARAARLKSTGWIRRSFVRRIQCETYFNSCFFSSWLHLYIDSRNHDF